jgi:hypothetical protein
VDCAVVVCGVVATGGEGSWWSLIFGDGAEMAG